MTWGYPKYLTDHQSVGSCPRAICVRHDLTGLCFPVVCVVIRTSQIRLPERSISSSGSDPEIWQRQRLDEIFRMNSSLEATLSDRRGWPRYRNEANRALIAEFWPRYPQDVGPGWASPSAKCPSGTDSAVVACSSRQAKKTAHLQRKQNKANIRRAIWWLGEWDGCCIG